MKIHIRLTTIAMKWNDGHWSVDTYTRMRVNSDEEFIKSWMDEYSLNGIEKIDIVENVDIAITCNTFEDFKNMQNEIRMTNPNVNMTILDY